MSLVRQSRKATLNFREFCIILIFWTKKLKNVHILINTHDFTPDIFIFKLGDCISFITFDLLILDCLFVFAALEHMTDLCGIVVFLSLELLASFIPIMSTAPLVMRSDTRRSQ